MNPTFKIAILISIAAHAAVLGTYPAFNETEKKDIQRQDADLSYIIIQEPEIAIDRENLIESIKEKKRTFHRSEDKSVTVTDKEKEPGSKRSDNAGEKQDTKDTDKQVDPSQIDQTAFLEYFDLIREKIRSEIHKRGGVRGAGEVQIIFTVSPKGDLLRIDNIKAGRAKLFDGIVRCMKNITPFPGFPEQLGFSPITFSLTIKIS